MKVLVVDDAVTFRTQIRRLVDGIDGVEVVGTASNGRIAIEMLQQAAVDLIILDLNMPEMGGIETIEKMQELGLKKNVIIFASMTTRNARDTVRALSLGASDFVVKPDGETTDFDDVFQQVQAELIPRITQFLPKFLRLSKAITDDKNKTIAGVTESQIQKVPARVLLRADPSGAAKKNLDVFMPQIIVVASSTGGPKALETLFGELTTPPTVPILVAQHMPETFTKFLAKRIGEIHGIECREAINGEVVSPGIIYFAPGNYHMKITRIENSGNVIILDQGPRVNSVRPAADLLFDSVSKLYGKNVMGFVLTGMGADGARGCQALKSVKGSVMIQDEATSVVWGMPGEVHRLDAYDVVGSLTECGRMLARMSGSGRGL